MLNPSTADAVRDDPTIRRCIGFAKAWGAGGMVVVNLFAYRASSPRILFAAEDPVGPQNDRHLLRVLSRAGQVVVAAWGSHGSYRDRDAEVLQLLMRRRIHIECLGRTADGQPRHPLYLPASQPLKVFTRRMSARRGFVSAVRA
jgi:hypothetical protein